MHSTEYWNDWTDGIDIATEDEEVVDHANVLDSEDASCSCDVRILKEIPTHIFEAIDRGLLVKLAEDTTAEPAVLDRLADSNWTQVRSAVADNPRSLIYTLLKLAYDVDSDVRYQLAENAKTPKQVLRILQKDENPFVSYRADLTMCRLSQ
jgi:hypothetical protein